MFSQSEVFPALECESNTTLRICSVRYFSMTPPENSLTILLYLTKWRNPRSVNERLWGRFKPALSWSKGHCLSQLFIVTYNTCGAVAHLGERLNGIQEVGGSSPPSSTKGHFCKTGLLPFFICFGNV